MIVATGIGGNQADGLSSNLDLELGHLDIGWAYSRRAVSGVSLACRIVRWV
jgi:hypothetical protein